MEGNLELDGDLIPVGHAFAFSDSPGSLQFHDQLLNPQFHQQDSPMRVEKRKAIEEPCERVNKLRSGQSRMSLDEKRDDDDDDGYHDGDGDEEKRESLWQRVKWTGQMVKLLISVVSYVEQHPSTDCLCGIPGKPSVLKKMGKWKCVSEIMVRRGYHVSPQQCEDKFNDMNKRYKRLNDVLGRGTSCKVVANPELLDIMNVPDKAKVKKILSSKNLFYEEMCSYHNRNRLHPPHDPQVQHSHSLQLALGGSEEHEPYRSRHKKSDVDVDKEQQDTGANDHMEKTEDGRRTPRSFELGSKKLKQMNDVSVCNPLKIKEYDMKVGAAEQDDQMNVNHLYPKDSSTGGLQEQWVAFRLLQLKEQKLQIQIQKHKLEKQRFKWQRINWNKDRVLDKMRLENQFMKLDNEKLAFELKHKIVGTR